MAEQPTTIREPKPDNLPRWDGGPNHYEVWYATTNHTPSGTGFWLRYTLKVPEDPEAGVATLWGFVFGPHGPEFAARQDYLLDDARLGDGAIMRIQDALLAEGALAGALTDPDGRVLTWDLSFEPSDRVTTPLPRVLERMAPTFYVNPNLDVRTSGRISLDDRVFDLNDEPMGQSHVWGKHHAGAWAWMHLHVADGFVIEAIQPRPHVPGPLADKLPAMPFALVSLAGHDAHFGRGLHRARGRFAFPLWQLSLTGPDVRFEVSVRASRERFVQVTYHDPSGDEAYCANSEVADAVVEVYRRYGKAWRSTEVHDLRGRAHVEFGARTPYPGVPISF